MTPVTRRTLRQHPSPTESDTTASVRPDHPGRHVSRGVEMQTQTDGSPSSCCLGSYGQSHWSFHASPGLLASSWKSGTYASGDTLHQPGTIPERLSPLSPSPRTLMTQETQTRPLSHRGTQTGGLTVEQGTQSDSDWETNTTTTATQTELTESCVDENNNGPGGPMKITKTAPRITYRERAQI